MKGKISEFGSEKDLLDITIKVDKSIKKRIDALMNELGDPYLEELWIKYEDGEQVELKYSELIDTSMRINTDNYRLRMFFSAKYVYMIILFKPKNKKRLINILLKHFEFVKQKK